jgi:hypothetical protein
MSSSAANSAVNTTTNAANVVMDKVKNFLGDKGHIVVMIVVVLLVFILVIVYISFALKASNLKGKLLTKSPIKLDDLQTPFIVDAGDIPKPSVGREYSYSFWMYIDNFVQTNDAPQMVMYRGTQNSIGDANPIVMMDGNSNKLYFVIKTQGSSLSSSVSSINYDNNLQNVLSRSYFNNRDFTLSTPNTHKHIIMSIDYVPLQRWVHVTVVIDNKIITVFMDGEIYSVKSIDEYKMSKQPEFDVRGNKIDYNLIIEKTEGTVYLGKFNGSKTPSAYLSNLGFYNYAISLSEVKKVYMQGPFAKGNFLSAIGISSYGVRSPIFKIDEYQAAKQ